MATPALTKLQFRKMLLEQLVKKICFSFFQRKNFVEIFVFVFKNN